MIRLDPFRDCEKLYSFHFMDRMNERHLPRQQVEQALREGKITMIKKGEYLVKWKRWELALTLNPCVVFLKTAFHSNF